jgi:hypothetical protein
MGANPPILGQNQYSISKHNLMQVFKDKGQLIIKEQKQSIDLQAVAQG